jgi:2-polyprenyl-6-methoxyphenol hydroxylase-like FAD-dependent oxidoreductase
MGAETTSLVIVGAGPAGLAAAITLAELEVPCLVVDRFRERSAAARGTVDRLGRMSHGRGWFRTSDLSRVKRDPGDPGPIPGQGRLF